MFRSVQHTLVGEGCEPQGRLPRRLEVFRMAIFFGICFILYFFKLLAGLGFFKNQEFISCQNSYASCFS